MPSTICACVLLIEPSVTFVGRGGSPRRKT
jgi:hypothetical protein